MLRISEIKMPLDAGENELWNIASKMLKIDKSRIKSLNIAKKSVDARHKDNICFIYSVDVEIDGDENSILSSKGYSPKISKIEPYFYSRPETTRKSRFRPVVVGFGPAGFFASLLLAEAGLNPLVIERGNDVDTRHADVRTFWKTRTLNENSNVQFGEGGAGTFSDGKLTTGIKDKRCRKVLETFCEMGAPKEILYSSRPHIGTDKLGIVVKNIRERVISLGGEVLFGCRLERLIVANGAIHGISYADVNGETIDFETDTVILAIGHSARDTVEMLYNSGIKMEQKPFSVGARIEHPQKLIDKSQYGAFSGNPALGAADYKLSCHPPHGRGAYTFCMCPGGTVVCASSEKGEVVVNGMSEYARDGENANSALLVGIGPENFPSEHPLAGMYYQREIEQKAFRLGGSDYHAPAQLVGDFLDFRESKELGSVNPTCPTGVVLCDMREFLPKHVTDVMFGAIPEMDRKLRGFALPDAVLTGPETRSSSPVRILRDELRQSNIGGLYPCGEGAGYAGGIVSAAVDGMKSAESVINE